MTGDPRGGGRPGADRLPARRFDAVAAAFADLRDGRMVVLSHGEDAGSQGDLLLLAEHADTETINFMAREARGIISLALTAERCDELGLEAMSRGGWVDGRREYVASIEARDGVSTGISAHDRAHTVRTAIDPDRGAEDIVQPGHVLTLRARRGGVPEFTGRAEVAMEMARGAGGLPAAVISEILNEDGSSARLEDLFPYAAARGLRIVSDADLIRHRSGNREARGRAAAGDRERAIAAALERFATGVTVVTACSGAGETVGATVVAFSPVSLRPPLISVCLARESPTLAAIHASGRFAVNILGADQERCAELFARGVGGAGSEEFRFETDDAGMAVLPRATTTIACRTEEAYRAGDHEIVVGEVFSAATGAGDVAPLVLFDGAYRSFPAGERG